MKFIKIFYYRLEQEKRISETMCWILTSLYLSKLSLLLTPLTFAIPTTFLLLVTTLPLYFEDKLMTKRRVSKKILTKIYFLFSRQNDFRVIILW